MNSFILHAVRHQSPNPAIHMLSQYLLPSSRDMEKLHRPKTSIDFQIPSREMRTPPTQVIVESEDSPPTIDRRIPH